MYKEIFRLLSIMVLFVLALVLALSIIFVIMGLSENILSSALLGKTVPFLMLFSVPFPFWSIGFLNTNRNWSEVKGFEKIFVYVMCISVIIVLSLGAYVLAQLK